MFTKLSTLLYLTKKDIKNNCNLQNLLYHHGGCTTDPLSCQCSGEAQCTQQSHVKVLTLNKPKFRNSQLPPLAGVTLGFPEHFGTLQYKPTTWHQVLWLWSYIKVRTSYLSECIVENESITWLEFPEVASAVNSKSHTHLGASGDFPLTVQNVPKRHYNMHYFLSI